MAVVQASEHGYWECGFYLLATVFLNSPVQLQVTPIPTKGPDFPGLFFGHTKSGDFDA